MKQAVLLCYNLAPEKAQKIRLAAMRLKIRVRPVAKEEYGQTLAALCGMEETTNTFLGLFRRMGIAPVALKAILTPTNAQWDSEKLHAEIASEHEAMMKGNGAAH